MTEAEWHASADPRAMLEFLRGRRAARTGWLGRLRPGKELASPRKLHLFDCGWCRLYEPAMAEDGPTRTAVEATERYADGLAAESEVETAWDACLFSPGPAKGGPGPGVRALAFSFLGFGHYTGWLRTPRREAAWTVARVVAESARRSGQSRGACDLLRCIFNPFPGPPPDPAWLTWDGGTVAGLVRTVYEQRAFDRLPILADALEDAGCADDAILSHCRRAPAHARGCWVVDRLLGKE
jgi:hypothetical protein